MNICEMKDNFLKEIENLHKRNEISKSAGADYFEPGMMEYPEQSDGILDEETGEFEISFEVKGTRYEGRTEQIEKIKTGDSVLLVREKENPYNSNNFRIYTCKNKDVGHVPAALCNAMAPLYDQEYMKIETAEVSYVEPISIRSRYAKQAMLFVKVSGKIQI